MTMAAIPRTSSDLTAPWLTAALGPANLNGASVASFAKREIGAGIGILTELVRLSLHYDRPTVAPTSLIAKFAASSLEARTIAQMYNLYENEVHFYRELAAETPVRTPHCYFVHFDPVTRDVVLLLEDLSEAQLADQLVGCPPDQAAHVVRDMAAMHAFWWEHPRLAVLPWLHRLCDPIYTEGVPRMYHRNAPISLERLGAVVPAWFPTLSSTFGNATSTLLQRLDCLPQTLAHGDFRLDNLLFGDGVRTPLLTILDWQIVLRGPGIYDLGYFLSQSLSIEDRRAHEADLLALYHDHMLQRGVQNCDREELWQAYRLVSLYCLVYPMIAGAAVDIENPRALDLLRCAASRAWAAIEDHQAVHLLPR
jgi:hypothetical protein